MSENFTVVVRKPFGKQDVKARNGMPECVKKENSQKLYAS